MLYFKLYPFTLLRQCSSFTFLFMYLGELVQYNHIYHYIIYNSIITYIIILLSIYQSSNNLPQSARTLDFDPKSCLVLLKTSSRSTRCWLASVSLFVALVCLGPRVALLIVELSPSQSLLLNTSSYSAHSWLVSVSIFLPLFCWTPRVALLVVDLAPSQSLPLWFAQHLGVDPLVVDLSRQSVSTFRALCWNLL